MEGQSGSLDAQFELAVTFAAARVGTELAAVVACTFLVHLAENIRCNKLGSPVSLQVKGPAGMAAANKVMPVLSKFYGIVIRMVGGEPLHPQFHAFYGDFELVVTIWPLRVVQGEAPRRVRDMVMEWATAHQQELLSAWNRCRFGLAPQTISPLE